MLRLDEGERPVPPAVVRAGLAPGGGRGARRDWYLALLELLRVRARTVDEVVRQAEPYFRDEVVYDADAVAKQWKDRALTAELLREVRERLGSLDDWSPEPMEESLREMAEARSIGAGKIFQPMRVALTGLAVSPGIFDVLVALGRDRSLARLEAAVGELAGAA